MLIGIAKRPKNDRYKHRLASMVYNNFWWKACYSEMKKELILMQVLITNN